MVKELFVVDIETTGINPMRDEILTLYGLKTDLQLNILAEVELQFKPRIPESKWSKKAEKIHGISYARAMCFPDHAHSFGKLLQFLSKGMALVCHANYRNMLGSFYFDKAFIEYLFLEYDKRFEFFDYFSISLSTHTMFKEIGHEYGLKKFDLKSIVNATGGKYEGHHDAKADVYMAYEAIRAYTRRKGHEGAIASCLQRLGRPCTGVRTSVRSEVQEGFF